MNPALHGLACLNPGPAYKNSKLHNVFTVNYKDALGGLFVKIKDAREKMEGMKRERKVLSAALGKPGI